MFKQEGIAITNPRFYSQLTLKELQHILRGDNGVLPMLVKERLDCLHEVGSALLEKYEGICLLSNSHGKCMSV